MRVTRSADLGALVAEKREKLGLSQQQLAEESGVTRDWLNRFERGKSTVTLHRVLWVMNALKLEMSVNDGQ